MNIFEQSTGLERGSREWYEERLRRVVRRYGELSLGARDHLKECLNLQPMFDVIIPQHKPFSERYLREAGLWDSLLDRLIEHEEETGENLVEFVMPRYAILY